MCINSVAPTTTTLLRNFKSIEEARQFAEKNEGSEALVKKVDDNGEVSYDVHSINEPDAGKVQEMINKGATSGFSANTVEFSIGKSIGGKVENTIVKPESPQTQSQDEVQETSKISGNDLKTKSNEFKVDYTKYPDPKKALEAALDEATSAAKGHDGIEAVVANYDASGKVTSYSLYRATEADIAKVKEQSDKGEYHGRIARFVKPENFTFIKYNSSIDIVSTPKPKAESKPEAPKPSVAPVSAPPANSTSPKSPPISEAPKFEPIGADIPQFNRQTAGTSFLSTDFSLGLKPSYNLGVSTDFKTKYPNLNLNLSNTDENKYGFPSFKPAPLSLAWNLSPSINTDIMHYDPQITNLMDFSFSPTPKFFDNSFGQDFLSSYSLKTEPTAQDAQTTTGVSAQTTKAGEPTKTTSNFESLQKEKEELVNTDKALDSKIEAEVPAPAKAILKDFIATKSTDANVLVESLKKAGVSQKDITTCTSILNSKLEINNKLETIQPKLDKALKEEGTKAIQEIRAQYVIMNTALDEKIEKDIPAPARAILKDFIATKSTDGNELVESLKKAGVSDKDIGACLAALELKHGIQSRIESCDKSDYSQVAQITNSAQLFASANKFNFTIAKVEGQHTSQTVNNTSVQPKAQGEEDLDITGFVPQATVSNNGPNLFQAGNDLMTFSNIQLSDSNKKTYTSAASNFFNSYKELEAVKLASNNVVKIAERPIIKAISREITGDMKFNNAVQATRNYNQNAIERINTGLEQNKIGTDAMDENIKEQERNAEGAEAKAQILDSTASAKLADSANISTLLQKFRSIIVELDLKVRKSSSEVKGRQNIFNKYDTKRKDFDALLKQLDEKKLEELKQTKNSPESLKVLSGLINKFKDNNSISEADLVLFKKTFLA